MSTAITDATMYRSTCIDDPDRNERLWALVAQLRGREVPDPAADPFGELYRATSPALLRFVRGRVGSHQLAEDLVADTYERAIKRVDRLERGAGSPAAWLSTIARNLISDHWKMATTRKVVLMAEPPARTPEGRAEHLDDRDQTMDQVLAARESSALAITLSLAVGQLTPEQREVLHLRYVLGLTIAETAAKVGADDSVIKSRAYRAIRSLARNPEVAALGPARCRPAA